MATILIPTVLRRFTGNLADVRVEAATVTAALNALVQRYPDLGKHLFDGAGKPRSFVNIYLGADDVRHLSAHYETALGDGDTLTIVPSIAGGAPAELPELTRDETRRYSRHLMLPEVGLDGQRRIKAASVLVIGAGGLGSPLLAYLAAAGVGRIGIVDGDTVDETNLQRQIIHGTRQIGLSKLDSARSFIANLNPAVTVETYDTLFTSYNALGIAAGYDVLIDGTDNFPTRYLVNDAAYLLGKPNVYGSIFRFEGQASVFCTENGPCYRCLYPEPPPPGLVPSCAEGGVLGVLPGIIGSIQACEALKLILGVGESLAGRLLRFDALQMRFHEFNLRRDPDCPLCGSAPTITGLMDYAEFCGLPQDGELQVPDEKRMTVQELHRRLRHGNGNTPLLVDVRNPEEIRIAALDGATLIPLPDLSYRLHEIPRNRDVVLMCHHGIRSALAWHELHEAGFERIFNLEGGIAEWTERIDPQLARY